MGEKKGSGIEQGHHGDNSAGMGTDGGAPGSHEGKDKRHGNRQTQQINTGHPDELERFDEKAS